MRCLNRNKKQLYYALYSSKEAILDAGDNRTGEHEIKYSNPVSLYANVSPGRGSAEFERYGIRHDYDKTIVTDDVACPIEETSILWIDIAPTIAADGTTTTPNDYMVKRVLRG
jgi:hypothetical protein